VTVADGSTRADLHGERALPAPPPPRAPEAHADATAPDGRRLRLGYRPELDGIRGLALVIVVLHHAGLLLWTRTPRWFLPGGQVGLDVFFALSGFLITALLLGEHGRTGGVRVGNFLWRRLLRLSPALVVFMAGLLVASIVIGRYRASEVLESAAWVLPFATNIGVENVIIEAGHTWSMGVEAHFYLAWCLVVALVARRVRRPYAVLAGVALAAIAASAIARALVFTDDGGATAFAMYVDTLYRIDAPLVGAVAGVAWVAGWADRISPRVAAGAAAAALALLAVVTFRTTPLSPILFQGLYTAVAAAGALLVVGVQRSGPSRVRSVLALPVLTFLGTISYSVYLWHMPVLLTIQRNAPGWAIPVRITVAVAASLALGALSYRFVERPFLRRKARATA
jgi:peptidoglycan/LPS O-acetylase OafA/YrhL